MIIRKLGYFLGTLLLMFTPLLLVSMPTASAAVDAKSAVCEGLEAADGASGCNDPAGSSSLNSTVTAAINLISIVVAVVAVIMVIVGGLKYVTSQGESSGTASAKNTIIYAMVGLIVVALAQLIVRFVANRVTPAP